MTSIDVDVLDVDVLRKDPKVPLIVLARNRIPSSCAIIARSNREHPNVAR